MTKEFLKLQISLLVAQHGRKAVTEAIAIAGELTVEQLQAEITRLGAARPVRAPKKVKSINEILASLSVSGSRRDLVARAGAMFEAKRFLPSLRDAQDFLHRRGTDRKYKKRSEALPAVLKAFSEMEDAEAELLLRHSAGSAHGGDFALLANQLMGKGD